MRDILLSIVIFGSVPAILVSPAFGIIMWDWVSLMNPHRLTWDFASQIPVAMIIAITTLVAWAVSKENKRIPNNSITVLMFILLVWVSLTTLFAFNQEDAQRVLLQFVKIILMVFVTICIMNDKKRVDLLVWIMVLSIGYFGFKGGIFTILTGGQHRVWGPPGSFIGDNNALALAILMIIPLQIYLAKISKNKFVKLGLYLAVMLCIVSVIGSWSRGGFLGLIVLGTVLWWRSKRRAILAVGICTVLMFTVSLIPEKWFDRMDTIENYEEDESANARLEIWAFAIRVANARPIVGGGFEVFVDPVAHEKWGENIQIRNVHSIYFQMLGSHGYPGLIIFLLLGYLGIRTCARIRRLGRDNPEFEQHGLLAGYISCSLVSFAVAGAFQNLATFDLYYNMLAIIAILAKLVTVEAKQPDPQADAQPLWRALLPRKRVVAPTISAGTSKTRSFVRDHG